MMPFDVYLDSEKRPVVSIDANRVEKKENCYRFYNGDKEVAMFKDERVFGYIQMTPAEASLTGPLGPGAR
jgi:hypothetical protein